jgi:hypothetical protein
MDEEFMEGFNKIEAAPTEGTLRTILPLFGWSWLLKRLFRWTHGLPNFDVQLWR